jgi:hypothetical protein
VGVTRSGLRCVVVVVAAVMAAAAAVVVVGSKPSTQELGRADSKDTLAQLCRHQRHFLSFTPPYPHAAKQAPKVTNYLSRAPNHPTPRALTPPEPSLTLGHPAS